MVQPKGISKVDAPLPLPKPSRRARSRTAATDDEHVQDPPRRSTRLQPHQIHDAESTDDDVTGGPPRRATRSQTNNSDQNGGGPSGQVRQKGTSASATGASSSKSLSINKCQEDTQVNVGSQPSLAGGSPLYSDVIKRGPPRGLPKNIIPNNDVRQPGAPIASR
jgi:hypothetical protein